jgi:hypothetical protein
MIKDSKFIQQKLGVQYVVRKSQDKNKYPILIQRRRRKEGLVDL